ncbi:MAG: hypothetical protein ACR2PF_07505 [Rhizobiaceae bacterium]
MPPVDPKKPRPEDVKPVGLSDLPVSGNLERRVDSFMIISLAIGLALMAGSRVFAGLSDVESRLIW